MNKKEFTKAAQLLDSTDVESRLLGLSLLSDELESLSLNAWKVVDKKEEIKDFIDIHHVINMIKNHSDLMYYSFHICTSEFIINLYYNKYYQISKEYKMMSIS